MPNQENDREKQADHGKRGGDGKHVAKIGQKASDERNASAVRVGKLHDKTQR